MPLSLLDISNSLKNASVCIKVPELQGGKPVEVNGHLVSSAGGYCVVYKYQLANGDYKALRIWHKDLSCLPDLEEVASKVSAKLTELNSNYFVEYKYYDKAILVGGQFYPIVVMDWCEGQDLKDYISENINDRETIREIANQFLEMVKYFHDNNISHGDLQHGNIRIRKDGSMCVLDYDSMYVPSLNGKIEYIKGLPSFQHPTARENNKFLSPKVDYFSEVVIYLSLMLLIEDPDLWTDEIKKSDDILLFDNSDLQYINTSSSRLFKFRNTNSNNILWLIRGLQDFMSKTDIEQLRPLEKVLFQWLTGGPSRPSGNKERGKTECAKINLDDLFKTFKM